MQSYHCVRPCFITPRCDCPSTRQRFNPIEDLLDCRVVSTASTQPPRLLLSAAPATVHKKSKIARRRRQIVAVVTFKQVASQQGREMCGGLAIHGLCLDALVVHCCRHLMGPRARVCQPGKHSSDFRSLSTIQPVEAHAACAHPETRTSSNGRSFGSTQSSSKKQ
jgi:hypothetical protein